MKRFALLLLSLGVCFALVPASPGMAQTCYNAITPPACPTTGLSTLDTNRCNSLRSADLWIPVDPQTTTVGGKLARKVLNPYAPCSGTTPNPIVNPGDEGLYYRKALAMLAMADMSGNTGRIAEANQILRYALLQGWPAPSATSLNYDPNNSSKAQPWYLSTRSLAIRPYLLYAEALEPDVFQEYEKRFGYLRCTNAWTGGSENQKTLWNSTMMIAHDVAPTTTCPNGLSSSTYASDVRSKLTATTGNHSLRVFGESGLSEAGNPFYNAWTVTSALNLADFLNPTGANSSVRSLAEAVVDYFVAQQAAFSRGYFWTSPAVRWVADTNGPFNQSDEPTNWALMFFAGAADRASQMEFMASNYRPLEAHKEQFLYSGEYQVQAKQSVWRHHLYHGDGFALGVQRTLDSRRYQASPGITTHDVVTAYVRSAHNQKDVAFAYGYQWNDNWSKRRGDFEMSFGWDNVALVHNGGTVRPVFGGSGTYVAKPRFVYDRTRFTQGNGTGNTCWSFLSDAKTYVAWAPTQGNAVVEQVNGDIYSLTTSLATIPATGVTSVVEVVDAADWASFLAFQQSIVSRNACPQVVSGKVNYTTRAGTVMTFTPTFGANYGTASVQLSGGGVPLQTWTQTTLDGVAERIALSASGYSFNHFVLSTPAGRTVTFDFPNSRITGNATSLQRVARNFVFGNLPVTAQQVTVAVDTAVSGFLKVTQGTAAASADPVTATTTLASSTDNLWHASNNYIGLSGLNALTSHGATENSPPLKVRVTGLKPGTVYDLYGRMATASLETVPNYWGVEMAPSVVDLVRYDQDYVHFTKLRDFGNWEEWEIYLGEVTADSGITGATTLVLDDETVNKNAVWTGLRLTPAVTLGKVLTKTISITEDSYTTESAPNANYGTADFLRLRTPSPNQIYSWLKLPVSGVSGKILRARLKLHTQDQTIDAAYVYRICNTTWTESTINWSNQPAASNCGYQTGRGPLAPSAFHKLDLTSFLDGNGTYTVGIVTDDPDLNLDFDSSESPTTSYRPVVEVVYSP